MTAGGRPRRRRDGRTTVAALRARVAAFMAARDWARYHAPKNLAMALACEAAELMELFLWVDAPASREVARDPGRRARVEAEMADVAICLLNFCTVTGLDLAAAVERKLADAERKYPADRVRGRADKYDEYPEMRAGRPGPGAGDAAPRRRGVRRRGAGQRGRRGAT